MFSTRSHIVGSLVFLFCASTALGQPGTQPGGTPGGPPGFRFPQPGEVLTGFIQDLLKLTPEQKKQLTEIQKEVDGKLDKLLTAEQKKSLEKMRPGKGGFGFGPGFGPPGGGPGGAPPGGVPGGVPPKGLFGPPPGSGGFGSRTEDVQKKIGATDEEWKVIGPKLQKVIAARRALSGETGPGGGPFGGATSSIVAQAQADLKAVLEEPKHTKTDVDEKIAAVRKAREKARTDLQETQRDLARLLTPAQQTIMISLGHLE